MNLVIHDTLSGEKRPFTPTDPDRVTMYVCGPTVYNYAHIGNARPVVVFDVLFRLLRHVYGAEHVVYARNITDVDDKINAKAAAEGVPIGTITDRFTAIYNADMAALGALSPSAEPRATQHIEAMLDMIGRLIDAGFAYAAEGHVLFDTRKYADYGALSRRSLDDMIAGARVEVAPYKRDATDFVLWKPSKPGEPEWPSQWGPGRPGWHIECSAMVEQTLGMPIDIHGGGHDLVFPHHENEIAQSRCATHGGPYANYWMHNGFLTIEAEKMSKSIGNVLLVHDLIEQVPGEAIRWALLAAHYRAPLDWNGELLAQARNSLDRLYGVLRDANARLPTENYEGQAIIERLGVIDENIQGMRSALFDDLNTPKAFAELFVLADNLRAALSVSTDATLPHTIGIKRDSLVQAAALLGFLQADPDAWFEGGADDDLKAKVEALLQTRIEARAAKDWATADRIRDELNALNVVVMDSADGATWRLREGVSVKLEHRLGIQAPINVVWDILADLPSWHEWNPLYTEAKGVIGFGELLTLTLVLPKSEPRVIQPRIVDWTPNEAIHWNLKAMGGLVSTIRYLELEKLHDEGCIFSNGELFQGLLGPTVARRIKWPAREGFAAMGEALRDRAEARWRAGAANPT